MIDNILPTYYAPAERASEALISLEANMLMGLPLLGQILDSFPNIVLILNEHRQIVFVNQAAVDAFDFTDREEKYGLRPGEALDCIHADETFNGCGTTPFCKTCGAVKSILSGLHGKTKTEECRITQKTSGNALDLRITSTPFKEGGYSFVIFVVMDISHEKRRNILERTFFHDISNTLTRVVGCTELLSMQPVSEQKDLLEKLVMSVDRLREEINSQKGLIAAESGDLSAKPVSIRSLEFLREILTFYNGNSPSSSDSAQINLDDRAIDIVFVSDKTLLNRVLGNMLKNALEASVSGDKILVGCKLKDEKYICFWVQNPQCMPPETRLQIFNRSFSTKGKGRGIGTYSMKLLTERYLKGRVAFSTTHEQGTIFSVSLPYDEMGIKGFSPVGEN